MWACQEASSNAGVAVCRVGDPFTDVAQALLLLLATQAPGAICSVWAGHRCTVLNFPQVESES